VNNPTRVAEIEMHASSGYPLYCAESRQRWFWYPAPYWYNGSWAYATPWLWYDGNKHGGYTYSQWQTKINTEMNVPSPVTTTIIGAYNPSTRFLMIQAKYRNDTTVALTNARSMCVITEDSLYYSAPNGDVWHNHVARKYLPNINGHTVTIAAGDSVTVLDTFTLNAAWIANKCQAVVWLQNTTMLADSTKPIYQGGLVNISALPIEEIGLQPIVPSAVQTWPNPCVKGTAFSFSLSLNAPYTISIFDITGRLVNQITGSGQGVQEQVKWNRHDRNGQMVGSGVYLFRFESGEIKADGKIVVN
jgi:hypothetical protein